MRRVLSEAEMERAVRRAKIVNYTVFALFGALLLAAVIGVFVYRYEHTFRAQRWREEPDERTSMIDDLLREQPLVGMTEADVLELLGPNDNDLGYFQADGRYVYYLGPERGLFPIDSEWLLLDFTDGVVSAYSITTD